MKNLFLPVLLVLVLVFISFSGNFISSAGALSVDKKIESKVFKSFKSKYIFTFFGYVGCTTICTPRLQELSEIYEKTKQENIDISALFINLIETEDKEAANIFASYFNKEFKGISLNKKVLNQIQDEFNVYNIPSLSEDNEYNHTSFLFLLKRSKNNDYKLIRIYTQAPFDKKKIIEDLKIENF